MEGTSDPIYPADMATASQNPEACYQACLVALNNAPTFYYNIYKLAGAQQPTCNCVKDFKSLQQLPLGSTGAAYTVCPGEDPNGVIGVRTKVNTLFAMPGKNIRWKAELTNLDKATAIGRMGFQVNLPPYTRVVRSRTASRGEKPKLELTPFTNGSVVTWTGFSLPPGKQRLFQLQLAVAPNAPVNTALTLDAFTFVTGANSSDVLCPYSANDLTVGGVVGMVDVCAREILCLLMRELSSPIAPFFSSNTPQVKVVKDRIKA